MISIVNKLASKIIGLYNVIMIKCSQKPILMDIRFTHKRSDVGLSWRKDQGEKILRLEYDLNENSLVFDLGGYEGQWSSDIFSKYLCQIYIFEPVLQYANKIEKRFLKNKRISVFKFGLANETKKEKIFINKDSSSVHKNSKISENIDLVRLVDFMEENNINEVDLIKINIEGGEYCLLEDVIDTGFVKKYKNIQIQFHDFFHDAKYRMEKIQSSLKKTHFITYQYPFIFENWKIKENET